MIPLTSSRPQEDWEGWRATVYKIDRPLPQQQERECSLAFYAGMMAAFSRVSQIAAIARDEDSGSDDLEKFRQEIIFAATRANLDRSDGLS